MKVQHKSRDRISFLPQDTIEKILTLMPLRDALRTSILSRKWRYSWTTMPKLVFSDLMIVSSGDEEVDKQKIFKAIFHVLLLHRAPILEFSFIVDTKIEIFSEIDQIILYLSRSNNNIKKFIFKILRTNSYLLPHSFCSLQGLEHIDLSYCVFDLPLMNNGFSTLKSLRFNDVTITNKMLFQFLTSCPLLEEFTWARDECSKLELTESELVKLFKCLPSVQVLKLRWNIKHLAAGSMPHKLPIPLIHLRVLVLDVCFCDPSFVLCLISSSPNLEKIKIEMCPDSSQRNVEQTLKNLSDNQDYMGLNLDHLEEMEIKRVRDCASWMEFVKFIMAKSPVLKKARIELRFDVSADEEIKMLRDLVHTPFPRAANFIIERPKVNYR